MNLDPFPFRSEIESPLCRHLIKVSWEYRQLEYYRDGGKGREDILTADFIETIDSLPRLWFLSELLKNSQGAESARQRLATECEEAKLLLFPGDIYLRQSTGNYATAIPVKADALIETPSVFCLIETKRPKGVTSFQPQQLAREYVAVLRNCQRRVPLLWLVVPHEPPFPIQGHGKLSAKEAISLHLPSVIERADALSENLETLLERVEDVVAWITWPEICGVISKQIKLLPNGDPSILSAVTRKADKFRRLVEWHCT